MENTLTIKQDANKYQVIETLKGEQLSVKDFDTLNDALKYAKGFNDNYVLKF